MATILINSIGIIPIESLDQGSNISININCLKFKYFNQRCETQYSLLKASIIVSTYPYTLGVVLVVSEINSKVIDVFVTYLTLFCGDYVFSWNRNLTSFLIDLQIVYSVMIYLATFLLNKHLQLCIKDIIHKFLIVSSLKRIFTRKC